MTVRHSLLDTTAPSGEPRPLVPRPGRRRSARGATIGREA